MNMIYIIGFATLAVGVGLTAFVIGYKQLVIEPLADIERAEYLQMECSELSEYVSDGLFWSPENSKEARELSKNC